MIKHILKIVWEQRRSNLLIWMELLLVTVFLWMVMDQLYGFYKLYKVPKGFNIENTYMVDIQMIPGRELSGNASTDSLQKAYEEPFYAILEKIRHNANVEYASASVMSRPYNGSNTWSMVNLEDKKKKNRKSQSYLRRVELDFFKVFRIPIAYGKSLSGVGNGEIVLSKAIADSLFKANADAIGKQCSINGEKFTIVGVTSTYKYYDFSEETPTSYQQFAPSFKESLGSVYTPEICIRLKTNAPSDAAEKLQKELANIIDSPYYIREIIPFDRLKDTYFTWTGEVKTMKMSAAIIIFFLINVLLGIVGTFWFRTEQRKNEIGLRMAIGSSARSLRGYFLKESLLLMVLAALPAALIALQLRFFDIQLFKYWNGSWVVFAFAGITAFAILSAMVLLGTWIPVHKASRIQPSEALHYE